MNVFRLCLIGAFVAFAYVVSPAVYAQDCSDCTCTTCTMEPDYYSWANGGGGVVNPPTTTTCIAYGYQNQRCYVCVEAVDSTGKLLGYQTCQPVAQTGGCYCDNSGTPNCKAQAVCTYQG